MVWPPAWRKRASSQKTAKTSRHHLALRDARCRAVASGLCAVLDPSSDQLDLLIGQRRNGGIGSPMPRIRDLDVQEAAVRVSRRDPHQALDHRQLVFALGME